jgi:GNAT superfamily N-acetyltransferase
VGDTSVSVAARQATGADASRLIELDAEARASVVGQRGGALYLVHDSSAFDPGLLDDSGALVVVGTVDEIAFGYAAAVEDKLGDGTLLASLRGLYVEPGARELGVGEAMMDIVLAWCRERGSRGIDAIALPGDRATKNFFEGFGLTARAIVVHRGLNESGL